MGLYMIALHTTIGCQSNEPTLVPTNEYAHAPIRGRSVAHDALATETLARPGLASSAPPSVAILPAPVARVVSLPLNGEPLDADPLPPDIEPRVAPRAWKYIVLHHSATADGDVRSINGDHRGRTDSTGQPWLGIGYHFVIGNGGAMGDGAIEATFRWRDQLQGAHAGSRDYNEAGIGICMIGDFDKAAPTPRQVEAARHLVTLLAQRFSIPRANWLRHRDVQKTECPGRLFPDKQILGP